MHGAKFMIGEKSLSPYNNRDETGLIARKNEEVVMVMKRGKLEDKFQVF
jgi:hypothetical protein